MAEMYLIHIPFSGHLRSHGVSKNDRNFIAEIFQTPRLRAKQRHLNPSHFMHLFAIKW